MSRTLIVALLGSMTAAAGGSYLAVRHNAADTTAPVTSAPATPATPAPAAPVHETEGLIEAPKARPTETPDSPGTPVPEVQPKRERELEPTPRAPESRRRFTPSPTSQRKPSTIRAANESAAPAPVEATPLTEPTASTTPTEALPAEARTPTPVESAAETRTESKPEPMSTEVVIPASAVIGLEIENTVTSERARIEDRVDARVTRDVFADGRLALPAGSRVIGAVTLVERGGKVKERARLGVRFHTVVLASGRQVALRTEPIYREGDSPAGESSRKIGGAAVGGAVLGAILGGGKGALAGATAGAAGGTAAVMAGGRNPAVLSSGSIVTVKLSTPASFDVER